LGYSVPFPVAMDMISNKSGNVSEQQIGALIDQHVSGFTNKSASEQQQIHQQAQAFLESRLFTPETFNLYQLKGTPSHLVIDKKGLLQASEFGQFPGLEALINQLLQTE